jgi:hypothetical protein
MGSFEQSLPSCGSGISLDVRNMLYSMGAWEAKETEEIRNSSGDL